VLPAHWSAGACAAPAAAHACTLAPQYLSGSQSCAGCSPAGTLSCAGALKQLHMQQQRCLVSGAPACAAERHPHTSYMFSCCAPGSRAPMALLARLRTRAQPPAACPQTLRSSDFCTLNHPRLRRCALLLLLLQVVYGHLDDPEHQELQRGVSYLKLRPGGCGMGLLLLLHQLQSCKNAVCSWGGGQRVLAGAAARCQPPRASARWCTDAWACAYAAFPRPVASHAAGWGSMGVLSRGFAAAAAWWRLPAAQARWIEYRAT
jgi:hypothetical protein